MKKVILTALFLAAFIPTKAENTNELANDCHGYACEKMSEYEAAHGDNLTLAQYDVIYDAFYGAC